MMRIEQMERKISSHIRSQKQNKHRWQTQNAWKNTIFFSILKLLFPTDFVHTDDLLSLSLARSLFTNFIFRKYLCNIAAYAARTAYRAGQWSKRQKLSLLQREFGDYSEHRCKCIYTNCWINIVDIFSRLRADKCIAVVRSPNIYNFNFWLFIFCCCHFLESGRCWCLHWTFMCR